MGDLPYLHTQVGCAQHPGLAWLARIAAGHKCAILIEAPSCHRPADPACLPACLLPCAPAGRGVLREQGLREVQAQLQGQDGDCDLLQGQLPGAPQPARHPGEPRPSAPQWRQAAASVLGLEGGFGEPAACWLRRLQEAVWLLVHAGRWCGKQVAYLSPEQGLCSLCRG